MRVLMTLSLRKQQTCTVFPWLYPAMGIQIKNLHVALSQVATSSMSLVALQAQAAMDEVLDLSALADLAVNSSTSDVLAALKLLDGINRCASGGCIDTNSTAACEASTAEMHGSLLCGVNP